jgi:uncharacterized membrane protein
VVTAAAPTGPAYSIVLIAHVLCALAGLGTVAITGIQAWRARLGPDGPRGEAVRRYFRPGTNWAGRLLYGVPVFGFVLLALSNGAYDPGDGWVVAGLLIWLAAAALVELVIWPGERTIQRALAAPAVAPPAAPASAPGDELERTCRRVALAAAALTAGFVGAAVLMVGKP